MNRIEALERSWMKKTTPACRVGDLIRIHVRVIEGEKQRVQPFEGVVIGRRGGLHREMITVRKVSYGVGVERIFPIHSPFVERIEVIRSGKIRRAKLYFLRKLSGRAAKLTEREALSTQSTEPAVSDGDQTVAASEKIGAGAGDGGARTSS